MDGYGVTWLAIYMAVFGSPPCTDEYHFCPAYEVAPWEGVQRGPGHDDTGQGGNVSDNRSSAPEQPGNGPDGDNSDDRGDDRGDNGADCKY